MAKPIGNQTANLKPKDKVSNKLTNRFGPKSFNILGAAGDAKASPTGESAKKPVKYKKRKR